MSINLIHKFQYERAKEMHPRVPREAGSIRFFGAGLRAYPARTHGRENGTLIPGRCKGGSRGVGRTRGLGSSAAKVTKESTIV